ncbi:organic cation transporter, partial [Danaus plexippus plexippus]
NYVTDPNLDEAKFLESGFTNCPMHLQLD